MVLLILAFLSSALPWYLCPYQQVQSGKVLLREVTYWVDWRSVSSEHTRIVTTEAELHSEFLSPC